MDLQLLIDKGEELKSEASRSPKVDLWKNDVRATVAQYGEATVEVLRKSMRATQVITTRSYSHNPYEGMISRVQELLKELQQRNPADTQAQSRIILQKMEEARATLGVKLGTTTFNGPVTFGDNSPANSVQVSELMLAIIKEAEETLPEGDEKNKILSSLRAIVANPTFAAMAGASLPEIIKRLF